MQIFTNIKTGKQVAARFDADFPGYIAPVCYTPIRNGKPFGPGRVLEKPKFLALYAEA